MNKNENHYRRKFLMEFFDLDKFYKNSSDEEFEEIMENYMKNEEVLKLQDFIGIYLKDELQWLTNIGLIDAMDVAIDSVKRDSNINLI